MSHTFNFEIPLLAITDATVLLEKLDRAEVGGDNGDNSRSAGQLNRDLLHAADQLDLASQLVRQQYWALRGYVDFTVDGAE